jgi:arylsulfatase A-like enzyme
VGNVKGVLMERQTRRDFLKRSGFLAASGGILAGLPTEAFSAGRRGGDRPNILWITSEDNSPLLGCYGDEQAHTPHLDRLATEGVRYRNAFANAPVCSAARSTLITGMYACSVGIHNHRSRVRIPESFLPYPVYMRQAGYYCTNNSKTDYNFVKQNKGEKIWDVSSNKAHYKNRKPAQPFFAIFNIGTSHEGQLGYKTVERRRKQGDLPAKARISPEDVKFPPYHADTPVVRRDWSVYYDNMTLMDKQVGRLLDELDKSGLADDTIVFYYADHGGALPRGKRNIHDSGTRVPLIIRFGKKWSHLAPTRPGGWIENPVSFVDFPATVFSLMGIDIPKNFEGQAFLGAQKDEPRDHAYLFRGRMDERYDTVRAVRDAQWRYVRNYSPHRPWGQQYTYPFRVMPSMRSWYDAYKAGKCNAVQARYWQAKPAEELYDTKADPHEIKNLIDDSQYNAALQRLRKALHEDVIRTRDTGFIPEGMFDRLAGEKTLYEYAQSDAYPIEKILSVANLASSRNASAIQKLITACNDNHPVIRYWGATGCLILRDKAAPAKQKLQSLLRDDWPDIQIVAAEALSYLDETRLAIKTLEPIAKSDKEFLSLAAMNALDFMQQAGHISLQRIRKLIEGHRFKTTPERMAKYFRDGA